MKTFHASREIQATIDQVFAAMSDPAVLHIWLTIATRSRTRDTIRP
jgi:uncharacterized protein YndB with AHSA1/START domain